MGDISLQVDESLALERLEPDQTPPPSGNDLLQRDQFNPPPVPTETAESLAKRGDCHRLRGDYAAAVAEYPAAVQLDPTNVTRHVNRGLTQWLAGQTQPAVADFARALELQPGNLTALNGRGNALAAAGEHDRAIADYTEAL